MSVFRVDFRGLRGLLPFLILAACVGASPEAAKDGGLIPSSLRCEYLENPVGLDELKPRLTWVVSSEERGQHQTAYHILVAGTPEKLAAGEGDLWDSGKVKSDQTVNVVYAGNLLTSRMRCHWKVKVWDKDGRESPWSAPASWSMGLLDPSDWKAKWISHKDTAPLHKSRKKLFLPPARHYRKAFTLGKPVRRATVYASALGIYELRVNGRRVGDARFTPGWSDYLKRVYSNAYDVTELVKKGENALGVVVAEGWYSGYVGFGLLVGYGPHRCGRYFYGKTPALLAQFEVEYADGSRETVITDPSWKVTGKGPIREADIIMGETHDARMELDGWDRPGFDDSAWERAIRAEENGSTKAPFFDRAGERQVELGFVRPPKIQAYPSVPIRPVGRIRPVAVTQPKKGVYLFDMGQNFSGVVALKVRGRKGTRILLRHGEMLHPDGRLMVENLRRARAEDVYILRGDPAGETWSPRFTYHGFQFVEVTGLPAKPEPDTVTGVVLHSDTPLVSGFSCSDTMVNRLYQNIVWTQRSNFLEVPTDCPQRDERLGWTGDAQIYARAATYNADVAAFFTKWQFDLEESQRPNGAYPAYAPFPMQHGKRGKAFGTAWMDAGIICPYTIYKVYGDRRIIERHYASMERFMDFRRSISPDFLGVFVGNDWGDWLCVGKETPIEFIDTVYFAYTAALMAEMAEAIGKKKDAAEYRELFDRIKKAFRGKYIAKDGALTVTTQTAYATALFVDLFPEGSRRKAGERLAKLILDNDARMATGFLGTRPLLPALTSAGQGDLAARLLQSRRLPSWGYEVVNGATTVWERWNSYTKDKGFHNAAMNSFSHYAFGAVCEWMFQYLAGIDTEGVGFKRIVIRPHPPTPGSNPDHDPIGWVDAEYGSIRGKITSRWKRTPEGFELETTLPANTTARVFLPAAEGATLTEGGKPLDTVEGIKRVGREGGYAVLEVGSGTYRFGARGK